MSAQATSSPDNDQSGDLTYIEYHWPHLQPHIREAILTLIDAALATGQTPCQSSEPVKQPSE